ncbi:MAG: DUF4468 domain-containing protein [Saprospiraceae bacterium]|nr:DUF4468 domain-containing protein [Saprospiraceae bacterium]
MRSYLNLLLLFLLAISSINRLHAQDTLRDESGRLYYQLIDTMTGSKEELFSKFKIWIAQTYKSGKAVTQSEDRAAGNIIISPIFHSEYHDAIGKRCGGNFSYDLTVTTKDNKYRVIVNNISWDNDGTGLIGFGKAFYEEINPSNWSSFMSKKHNWKLSFCLKDF